MYERFDEFLAQRAATALPAIDLAQRKDEWLEALDTLYAKIGSILQPYVSSGRLDFSDDHSTTIDEEYLGRYQVRKARIALHGNVLSTVELNPIGTFILGARGRVDMVGPTMKAVKLMLVERNRHKAGIQNLARGSTFPSMPPEPLNESEWVWKIATPPPHLAYLELTEFDFLDALMFVMG